MRIAALALAAAAAAGCGRPTPDLSLSIRLPADRHLLAAVNRLDLSVAQNGHVVAQASFPASASFVSVAGVGHGPGTIATLEGVSINGDVLARGSTCPFDFEKSGSSAPLYFAPTNFFAPTVGAPMATRTDPIVVPLADGRLLLAGGSGDSGPRMDAELFSPGSASFTAATPTLSGPRSEAEVALVPGFGALVTGGVDGSGAPIAAAELYDAGTDQFVAFTHMLLDARLGHRSVVFSDGRVLVIGGSSPTATALASTAFVRVQSPGGSAQVTAGPPLGTARREHAAVIAIDVPIVIGGYGVDGKPLASIEALRPATSMPPVPTAWAQIATLQFPRAEATASLLPDGEILVVGGAGDAAGTPRLDAELYNPILGTTTVLSLATNRRAHTATVLADGRVLIAGGIGKDGLPLASVELFVPATATTPP
ncbi:MAG TPA: hypothetical protein VF945_04740, partial [Polyangia bacterium]